MPDPLENYKALEYAANHFLMLPTSKVKELTGKTPKGTEWEWCNFKFSKSLFRKAGREKCWKVQIIANSYKQLEELTITQQSL